MIRFNNAFGIGEKFFAYTIIPSFRRSRNDVKHCFALFSKIFKQTLII